MSRKRRKNTKKKSRKILILFIIVGLLGAGVGAYGFSILDRIDNTRIAQSDEELGINVDNDKDGVVNIALFGVDSRDEDSSSGARSDSIMIASLDREHDKIKLTSIMRDTYVELPGRGMDKIK